MGELGDNSSASSPIPVQVLGLTSGVTTISAGSSEHACAIVDGGVQCWGYNSNGQLGNNDSMTVSEVPVQAQGLTSGASAIATGAMHSCALVSGSLLCWGYNNYGEIGDYTTQDSHIPIQAKSFASGVTDVTAGEYHTCVLINGGVQCWGYNANGQLGNNSTQDSRLPVQVLFP